jgi:serine/threonine protein kinase
VEQLGRYKIEKVLGRGAMGTVYRAHDPKIDRFVAIKTITVQGVSAGEEEEYRERFSREAKAAGKLSHPGVVTIHDVGEQDGGQAPYIVMEYIEGTTLDGLIDNTVPEPISATLDLMKQVAEALDYAHSQGIVHRDIKPANIIITPEGRAKITDFGIAKLAVNQLTVPGEVIGTPSYMSPEQIAGGSLDGRSDLFSLGIILYSMLAGQKPFPGENATSVMFSITYKEPLPISKLNPALDPQFDHVMQRALAKSPGDRYQSAREFAEDLESLSQGRGASSSRVQTRVASELERTVVQSRSLPTPSSQRNFFRANWLGTILAAQAFLKLRTAVGRITWTDLTRRLSRKGQLGLAGLALFLAFFVFGSIGTAKTAKIEIRCAHSFVAADLFIWIDGKLAYEKELTGTVRKRLGLIKTVQGSFVDAVPATPGRHVLRVQVVSETAGYDQTREVRAELSSETTKTLDIKFVGRTENLDLEMR